MNRRDAVRILLVDDHPVVREGLKSILGLEADFAVVGEAGNAAEAVSLFERLEPDLTLLDFHLPDEDGATVTRKLIALRPDARIVIITSFERAADVDACLAAGARAWILKDSRSEELIGAIRSVISVRVATRQFLVRPRRQER